MVKMLKTFNTSTPLKPLTPIYRPLFFVVIIPTSSNLAPITLPPPTFANALRLPERGYSSRIRRRPDATNPGPPAPFVFAFAFAFALCWAMAPRRRNA
jgi:hypothetical protein